MVDSPKVSGKENLSTNIKPKTSERKGKLSSREASTKPVKDGVKPLAQEALAEASSPEAKKGKHIHFTDPIEEGDVGKQPEDLKIEAAAIRASVQKPEMDKVKAPMFEVRAKELEAKAAMLEAKGRWLAVKNGEAPVPEGREAAKMKLKEREAEYIECNVLFKISVMERLESKAVTADPLEKKEIEAEVRSLEIEGNKAEARGKRLEKDVKDYEVRNKTDALRVVKSTLMSIYRAGKRGDPEFKRLETKRIGLLNEIKELKAESSTLLAEARESEVAAATIRREVAAAMDVAGKGDIAADSIEEQIEARHAEARQLPPDSVEAKDLEASAKTLEVVAMLSKINEKKRRVAMLRAKGDEESIAKANGFEREIHTLVGQAIALEAEVQQLRGTDEALDLRLAAAKMRSDAHTKRAYAEKEIKKEKFERLLAEAKDLENEANQLLAEAERLEK